MGILSSTDEGRTWSPLSRNPGPRRVRCFLYQDGIIYAGTDTEGVFVSRDTGQSWAALNRGLPEGAQIFAMSAARDRVFAALYSHGLYGWNNADQCWRRVGNVSPLALASIGGSLIAGHNPGGIHVSEDLGESWNRAISRLAGEFSLFPTEEVLELPTEAPIWELATDNELAFAGAANGIYYSEDRGRNWIRARTGLPSGSPGVCFLLKKDLILAGTLLDP